MAAASRKEEERNERIVRGLLKLPPNRRCINCNGIGPQYVCTSFWTFICISCSGIHREFTHRVKSVSMSKFTVQEVEALQKGGNQRARESLLKDFDTQQMRLPDSSNINSLREFIRVVYVERRYAGVGFPERPPRDNKQSRTLTVINVSMIAAVYIDASEFLFRFKNHTKKNIEGLVPIIHFLEERRNGKQPAILTRKPGSDRGHDGKMSYRSNSLQERMSEDQFANETRESRTSDCSGSSLSDTVRTLPESPNFFDNGCSSAPFQQNQSDMLNFNGITQSQRTASTENIDSTTLKSGNSSLADLFFGSETAHGTQESNHFIAPSFVAFSDAVNGAEEDLFSRPNLQQQYATGLYPSVDFFANIPPTTSSSDKMPLEAPSLDNAGWATFDTPPKDKQPGVTGPSLVASIGKQTLGHDLFLFEPSEGPASFLTSNDKVSVSNHSGATYHDTSCSQLWHSFDDATGVMINDHSTAGPLCNEHQNVVNVSLGTSNPFTCSVVSEESQDDDCHKVFMEELAPSAPFAAFLEPSPISAAPSLGRTLADKAMLNPFDLPFDTDSEAPGLFMDMSTLQAALPNLPSSFLDGLPESWFSNNTSTYVPSGSHGGLSCLAEQAPNSPLRNITLSTVSTGNPFA